MKKLGLFFEKVAIGWVLAIGLPWTQFHGAGLAKMDISVGLMKWPSDKVAVVAGLDKVAIGASL